MESATALAAAATDKGRASRRLGVRASAMTAIGAGAAVVLVDQLTKNWALGSLQPGVPRRVLPFLHLNLAFNSGSAFSLGSGGGVVIGTLALCVACGVMWFGRRYTSVGATVLKALVFGGAVGNLADRLFRAPGGFMKGEVVDFLQLPHWPIFNVADMAVTAAAIVVAVLSLWRPDALTPTPA